MKKTKKVDLKKVAKNELSAMLAEFLKTNGIEVSTSAEDFGFTEGTLVVSTENCDVQVKFITPKAGATRYEIEEDEEDEEDEESEEA